MSRSFQLDVGYDCCKNVYGAIRLSHVRSQCFLNDELVDIYREWRDDSEFFILKSSYENYQDRLCGESIVYTNDMYRFVKASKRGNDVYKHLVTEKLRALNEIPNVVFFDDHTVDKRSCILFVTLTFDNKLCCSEDAWDRIGSDFHLFHNNLRKQYGKVEVFRTWESTNHYYPHVHCIILFWDYDFPVLQHTDKKGEFSYRIPYKEKQKISKYWHSNIDVQAVSDTVGSVKELTKYITKDLCSLKGDKTNAMIWFNGKRGYALSKGFVEAVSGWNIEFNEPTNSDLIRDMSNCNQVEIKWEFVGILRGNLLGFSPDIWVVDIKKPPDRIKELVDLEGKRWCDRGGDVY